jgi:hypothetical protein
MTSFITQPNIYVRGILFGKMKYELGDHSYVRCPETGLVADLEFKTKGYFGGTYNAIGGFIRDKNDKNLFEFSGHWNEEMYIKDLTVSISMYQETDREYNGAPCADTSTDRQEGVIVRRNKRKAHTANGSTTRRTR